VLRRVELKHRAGKEGELREVELKPAAGEKVEMRKVAHPMQPRASGIS
jgi:hypothetical protein